MLGVNNAVSRYTWVLIGVKWTWQAYILGKSILDIQLSFLRNIHWVYPYSIFPSGYNKKTCRISHRYKYWNILHFVCQYTQKEIASRDWLTLKYETNTATLTWNRGWNTWYFNSLTPGSYSNIFRFLLFKNHNVYCMVARTISVKLPSDKSNGPHWWYLRLVQVMAWGHQTTSHYLSHCWPRSLLSYGVTRPWWVANGLVPCVARPSATTYDTDYAR